MSTRVEPLIDMILDRIAMAFYTGEEEHYYFTYRPSDNNGSGHYNYQIYIWTLYNNRVALTFGVRLTSGHFAIFIFEDGTGAGMLPITIGLMGNDEFPFSSVVKRIREEIKNRQEK